jgi:hypothetical protein
MPTPPALSLSTTEENIKKGSTVTIFRITVEPFYRKSAGTPLKQEGYKKPDTRFDTHCIKTSVQLWSEYNYRTCQGKKQIEAQRMRGRFGKAKQGSGRMTFFTIGIKKCRSKVRFAPTWSE